MDVNRSTEPLTADDLKWLCDIAKKVLRLIFDSWSTGVARNALI